MTALRHNYSVYTHNGGICDTCGKERKTLYIVSVNPWDDVIEHVECFFCLLKGEKYMEQQERKMMEEWEKAEMERIVQEEELLAMDEQRSNDEWGY